MEHVKIKLILLNGRAMTFSADDYIKLRTEHRIIGKLIGISAPYPRNVNLQNLPACYSDYETRLMIEEELVEIYEKNFEDAPSDEMKEAFKIHQKGISEELQNAHMKNKLEITKQNMQQIIKGKRKKLIKSGCLESEIDITPEQIMKEEELRYRQTYKPQNLHSQIPTQHPFDTPNSNRIDSFPVSNITKYKVFHDLWKKGFYVTNAENFGGDFLTYSGDPIYFHATQIVHIINREELLEPHFLVSCGRLSVSVKKKCLFAYLNDDNVVYQNLEWDNPKVKDLYAGNYDKNKSDIIIEEDEIIT